MMIKGFLTNLADYNSGILNGMWVTFPQQEDDLMDIMQNLGIDDAHEYFFTDWSCDFIHTFEEFESVWEINKLAEQLEDVRDPEHLAAYMEVEQCDLEQAIDEYDNSIFYQDMSLLDVAYDIVENCYDLPDFAKEFFDYEKFADSLDFDGYHEVSNGVIFL